MSNYLLAFGGVSAYVGVLVNPDESLQPTKYRYSRPIWNRTWNTRAPLLVPQWQQSSRLYTMGVAVGTNTPFVGQWRHMRQGKAGQRNLKMITGYTYASSGSLLPGCAVSAYRVTDNSIQQTVTSDAGAAFTITIPYTDAHYLIAYLAGSPDVMGSTVNTITGV